MFSKNSSIKRLSDVLACIPGVSKKLAWRISFHILTLEKSKVLDISNTILKAYETTKRCSICQNYTDSEVCDICSNSKREKDILCVVESPRDVVALERSGCFFGRYHVLHGLLSPMDGVGPKQLTTKQLYKNIENNSIKEVILATNPTIEGEATAAYVARLLRPLRVRISRLGCGISIGSELQHADSVTLLKAVQNRSKI